MRQTEHKATSSRPSSYHCVVDEALLRTITAEIQAILSALGAAALPPPPSPATAAPRPGREAPNLRPWLSSPSFMTAAAPSAAGK